MKHLSSTECTISTGNTTVRLMLFRTVLVLLIPNSTANCAIKWRAQRKKGITIFDEPKRSKVNEAFSLSSKLLWLKFNSWTCVLLKSSLVIFLDTKKCNVDLWPFGIIKNGFLLFPLGPSNAPRPFPSVFFARCEQSKTGQWEGLGMRLKWLYMCSREMLEHHGASYTCVVGRCLNIMGQVLKHTDHACSISNRICQPG